MNELTQEILKELLHYNLETGIFTWKQRDIKWCRSEGHRKRWNERFYGHAAGNNVTHINTGKTYSYITVLGHRYGAHQLAFLYVNGIIPEQVDHEDGDGTHNWWANLRPTDHKGNMKNKRKFKNNTSGITGVSWSVMRSKWIVNICVNGKQTYLGGYDDMNDAISVRKNAEIIYSYHSNHGSIRPL